MEVVVLFVVDVVVAVVAVSAYYFFHIHPATSEALTLRTPDEKTGRLLQPS